MRYLIIFLTFFIMSSCINKTALKPIDIETMIDIHKETFGYQNEDLFYIRISYKENNISIIHTINKEKDHEELSFLEKYYTSPYKDINVIITEKDMIYIQENDLTNLEFEFSKNPNFLENFKPKISDYPQLDFYYDKANKKLDKIEDRGVGFTIKQIKEYPYYILTKPDLEDMQYAP